MTFQSVARTHVGAVRSCNEDSVLAHSDNGLWAVSDGMGGHAAGDVASALVVDALKAVAAGGDAHRLMQAAQTALADANAELYRRGSSQSASRTMGATVAVLGADASSYICLWAGDSRVYRFRAGKLVRLTHDHRYVQSLIDAGLLSEKEAEEHPRRSVITRAVGVDAELKLDVCEGALVAGDIFLLTTDGVTGVCKDAEIAAILSRGDIESAADAIVEKCLAGGAPDNLSLVLVRLS
jgi:serine/threonine protein phosphatase PrpC